MNKRKAMIPAKKTIGLPVSFPRKAIPAAVRALPKLLSAVCFTDKLKNLLILLLTILKQPHFKEVMLINPAGESPKTYKGKCKN